MEPNQKVELSSFIEGFTGSLAGVSTKYPVVAAGLAIVKVKSIKEGVKVKDAGEQRTLYIELETTTDLPEYEKDGGVVKAGHILTDTVLLTPTGEWTEDSTKKSLARILDGVFGDHDRAFVPSEIVGRPVSVRIGIRPAKDQFDARNQIDKYIPTA